MANLNLIITIAVGTCLIYSGHAFLTIEGCTRSRAYNALVNLTTSDDSCLEVQKVFGYLSQVTKDVGAFCRIYIIRDLAIKYRNGTPSHCMCSGAVHFEDYPFQVVSNGDHKNTCFQDHNYQRMYNEFFTSNQPTQESACRTHHSMWDHLSKIPYSNYYHTCQLDMVNHLCAAFQMHPEPCVCTDVSQTTLNPVPTATPGHLPTTTMDYYAFRHRCLTSPLYTELNSLVSAQEDCLEIQKVFQYLTKISAEVGDTCMIHIVDVLAAAYGSRDTPSHCDCQGAFNLAQYSVSLTDGVHDEFFVHQTNAQQDGQQGACRTHHSLWLELSKVPHSGFHSVCQKDIIFHLEYAFRTHPEPCVCTVKPPTTTAPTTTTTIMVTSEPEATTTTTSLPPTSETTPPSTTPPYIYRYFQCGKYASILKVAEQQHIDNENATVCDGNNIGSNEALVLTVCNTTHPDTWHRGLKVFENCNAVPHYSPIATFVGPDYNGSGAQSGVFIECFESGFKMLVDHCNGVPTIEYITSGGLFNSNPNYYYVIV